MDEETRRYRQMMELLGPRQFDRDFIREYLQQWIEEPPEPVTVTSHRPAQMPEYIDIDYFPKPKPNKWDERVRRMKYGK